MADKEKKPERHPNGTPRTIHHWEEDEPVYHDEVEELTAEERKQLGYEGTVESEEKASAAAAAGDGPKKKVKL